MRDAEMAGGEAGVETIHWRSLSAGNMESSEQRVQLRQHNSWCSIKWVRRQGCYCLRKYLSMAVWQHHGVTDGAVYEGLVNLGGAGGGKEGAKWVCGNHAYCKWENMNHRSFTARLWSIPFLRGGIKTRTMYESVEKCCGGGVLVLENNQFRGVAVTLLYVGLPLWWLLFCKSRRKLFLQITTLKFFNFISLFCIYNLDYTGNSNGKSTKFRDKFCYRSGVVIPLSKNKSSQQENDWSKSQ